MKNNKEKQPQVIEDRVVRLETKLKTKFSNCFESVRKAFLALDSDYDGIITVEDILKYFGNPDKRQLVRLALPLICKNHPIAPRPMVFSKAVVNGFGVLESECVTCQ